MVAAALDAAAGWTPPTGDERYCPVNSLLAFEPPSKGARGAWDPVGWLLDGWAGGWALGGSQAGSEGGASLLRGIQAPSGAAKLDPLGALRQVAPPTRRAAGSKFDPVKDLLAGEA